MPTAQRINSLTTAQTPAIGRVYHATAFSVGHSLMLPVLRRGKPGPCSRNKNNTNNTRDSRVHRSCLFFTTLIQHKIFSGGFSFVLEVLSIYPTYTTLTRTRSLEPRVNKFSRLFPTILVAQPSRERHWTVTVSPSALPLIPRTQRNTTESDSSSYSCTESPTSRRPDEEEQSCCFVALLLVCSGEGERVEERGLDCQPDLR